VRTPQEFNEDDYAFDVVSFLNQAAPGDSDAGPAAPPAVAITEAGPGLEPTECSTCHRETCEGHAAPRKGFVPAADVMAEPAPDEVIEGIAWAGCVSVLVGESATGKTFVGLAAGAAVAEGRDWHGRGTKAGSVAYVSFEGDALGLRLQALRTVQDFSLEHLYLLRASNPISPRIARDEATEVPSIGELSIVEALANLPAGAPPVVLLVIDTIRASMSGSEDNSENVSAYLRAVRRILATVPGAAAILTHHSGWQDGEQKRKRERGSSALRGNVDATLYLEVTEEDRDRHEVYLTLSTLKVRDAERWPPLRLVRRRVDILGFNRRGEPLSSCVVARDLRSWEDRQAEADAERQVAQATEDRTLDLKVLRTIKEYPQQATSKERLREYVGARKNRVADAVTRLLLGRLVVAGRRGEPYQITAEGDAFLAQEVSK
jgi:hypothetical protein